MLEKVTVTLTHSQVEHLRVAIEDAGKPKTARAALGVFEDQILTNYFMRGQRGREVTVTLTYDQLSALNDAVERAGFPADAVAVMVALQEQVFQEAIPEGQVQVLRQEVVYA